MSLAQIFGYPHPRFAHINCLYVYTPHTMFIFHIVEIVGGNIGCIAHISYSHVLEASVDPYALNRVDKQKKFANMSLNASLEYERFD